MTFLGRTEKRQDINRALRSLADGKSFRIGDYFDGVIGKTESIRNILTGDLDFYLAFGRTGLRGDSDVTATRRGDQIHFEGEVTIVWNDEYNFEPMQPYGDGAVALNDAGRAKFFNIRSRWRLQVTGTVDIVGGDLQNPRFQWRDFGE